MSEIKLISPLLDDYDIGSSISAHNGVSCYPAMKKGTTDRYIIKNVSVPASQTQLEALLLTGAYPDKDSAVLYFKDVTDAAVAELEVLRALSSQEGFTGYDNWQVEPKENANGFDVCMIGTYKYSLRKYLQHQPITHLAAINLGLDLCQALSACRKAGFLYVDLKPNNIYVEGSNFKIGDIGFLPLSNLKYATLPERYCSSYTAPEALDVLSTLSQTLDVYALGLILYQAYNGGSLPFAGEFAPAEKFQAPIFADYEMTEIILKACDPDPDARWQDPQELSQALVSYMQRNGANDVPIVPPAIEIPDEAFDINDEADNSDAEAITEENIDVDEVVSEVADLLDVTEAPEEDKLHDETSTEECVPEDEIDISFLNTLSADDTSPENNLTNIEYDEVSDELSQILSQADELIAESGSESTACDEEITLEETDVDTPLADESLELEASNEDVAEIEDSNETTDDISESSVDDVTEEHSDEADISTSEDDLSESSDEAEDTEIADEISEEELNEILAQKAQKRKKVVGWILTIIIFLLIGAITAVGFFYYKNIYLLPIDNITVDGNESSMVVQVDTNIDESILSVICSDSHGKQISAPVVNGSATFANLTPDTAYTVRILVDGFHRLTGETAASYSTPAQTNIVQFSAVTGSEDGSAIVSFNLEGPDNGSWQISCSAEGEETQIIDALSHMVTLTGLTVGKEYTFTLIPGEGMYVTGLTEIQFTASNLIYPENVIITGCIDGKLTATWDAPDGIEVPNWTVRCYDNGQYNQTTITTETNVTFEDINPSGNYTVEVTAAGMSVNEKAFMSENAVTITNFSVDSTVPNNLTLTWETNQSVPDNSYVVIYNVEASDTQNSVTSNENTVQITPVVPGATYYFKIQQENGTAVLSAPLSYQVPDAQDFSGYGMTRGTMSFQLCKRPESDQWSWLNVPSSDITSTFSVGQRIGIIGQLYGKYGISNDSICALFVIRDAEGNLVCYSAETQAWSNMWDSSYGEIDIPQIPTESGDYTVTVYFNGLYVTQKSFTII